jgi:hypothetical protein
MYGTQKAVTLVGLRRGNQCEKQTLVRVEAALLEYRWIFLTFIESARKVRFSDMWTVQLLYTAMPCFTVGTRRVACATLRYSQQKLTRNAVLCMDSHSDWSVWKRLRENYFCAEYHALMCTGGEKVNTYAILEEKIHSSASHFCCLYSG